MIKLPSTDISKALQMEKSKDAASNLKDILKIFQIDPAREVSNNISLAPNAFDFDRLETSRIYHIRHIKKVCIDYRLRFLDLRYFKPALPQEALEAIQQLETLHDTRLEQLKIVAPSRLFKLEDKDDPLLFVPLGNDYFYLVHKWGSDLHPLRKLWVWPFKTLPNLMVLVFLISFLATLMIPSGLFSKQESQAEFWILYFFMFKMIASIVLYYGFALGKNFNPAIWDSKYFNA
jgi:hypothetical protein